MTTNRIHHRAHTPYKAPPPEGRSRESEWWGDGNTGGAVGSVGRPGGRVIIIIILNRARRSLTWPTDPFSWLSARVSSPRRSGCPSWPLSPGRGPCP